MTDKYYTAYHYFRYCLGVSHESHNHQFSDHMHVDVWDNAVASLVAKYEG